MTPYEWNMIRNNYYLGMRDTGASRKLTGNVVVIHVLVNDMMSNWMYPIHVSEYQMAAAQMEMTFSNASYGSPHRPYMRSVYLQINLPMVADQSGMWINYAFASLGFPNAAAMQYYYESMYNCDEAPIIFAFNRPMRSFASANNDRSYFRQDEFSAVFRHTSYAFESRVLVHELLHQFGAIDYYYPQITVYAAQRYFPNSIMYTTGNEIDDLTRYLIGWTNELSDKAVAFLRDTMSVNDAVMAEARMRGV